MSRCGKSVIPACASRSETRCSTRARKTGERGDDRIARRVLVEAEDMAGVSPRRSASAFPQHLEHVAIADGGTVERDAFARKRLLETEIRHQRADDAARQRLAPPIVHSRCT
jgi:hypothetical protein